MPIQRCTEGGKRGWRWGRRGKCYTGKDGRKRAWEQGKAIKAQGAALALLLRESKWYKNKKNPKEVTDSGGVITKS